jgi:hypothetical protein
MMMIGTRTRAREREREERERGETAESISGYIIVPTEKKFPKTSIIVPGAFHHHIPALRSEV